jgi:hypothetical protein
MKNQVLSLLCGISFLVSSPVLGMDQLREEENVVARSPFPINSKTNSPLEILHDELKVTVVRNLHPVECCQLFPVSKRWYNFLLPYQVPFYLRAELVDLPAPGQFVMQTLESPDLSLKDCKLSLLYSPKDVTSSDNPLQLCSFQTPSSFTADSPSVPNHTTYCFNGGFQPVSYFKFHGGEPDKFFLQGVPKGWEVRDSKNDLCFVRDLKNDLCCVSCPSDAINLSSFQGQKLKLHLYGMAEPDGTYKRFSCSLSNPSYIESQKPSRVQMEKYIRTLYNHKIPLTTIQFVASIASQSAPMTIEELETILGITEETSVDYLQRPEDIVEALLKIQSDN